MFWSLSAEMARQGLGTSNTSMATVYEPLLYVIAALLHRVPVGHELCSFGCKWVQWSDQSKACCSCYRCQNGVSQNGALQWSLAGRSILITGPACENWSEGWNSSSNTPDACPLLSFLLVDFCFACRNLICRDFIRSVCAPCCCALVCHTGTLCWVMYN